MKFLVDAQLPAKLVRALDAAGHNALHSSQLPDGNRTSDTEIARRADAEVQIVVTKDADFRDSHLITGSPQRLLVVATGDIANVALLDVFERYLDTIVAAFAEADLVELHAGELVIHRRRDEGDEPR